MKKSGNVNGKELWLDEPVQSTSEAKTHQKKILPSIRRDWKSALYMKLFPNNQLR